MFLQIRVHTNFPVPLSFEIPWQATAIEFLKFINETFPPEPGIKYADPQTHRTGGAALLRPWMLPWSPKCGMKCMKGLVEPDRPALKTPMIVMQLLIFLECSWRGAGIGRTRFSSCASSLSCTGWWLKPAHALKSS